MQTYQVNHDCPYMLLCNTICECSITIEFSYVCSYIVIHTFAPHSLHFITKVFFVLKARANALMYKIFKRLTTPISLW